ncbi:MAG: lysylphosphatidylglycerol synthase transmembrane domain-containing protein [Deltaproteobacteria bacterium]|nr:lysylphosphatidylglycerol synthase transmembrane domain-containing protein [Deltaproteobacteria bacterium]
MKAFLKIFTSLFVGGLCTWLVVKNMEWRSVWAHLADLPALPLLLYIVTLAPTHFFRAARWEYLLRPLGVSLPLRRLLPISSVGFMAIMALPFRLGEFVRPYYLVREGRCRMSAALGTVAVERVVDGLIVSLILFGTYVMSRDQFARPLAVLGGAPLSYFAWLSLAIFLAATLFLGFALRWPALTIGWSLRLSLLPKLAPRLAHKISDKLGALIQGFKALSQPKHLVPFLLQSFAYWGLNGLGMWLLARGMGLPVSFAAAYAMMAFTGVVISLPNAPGLVGQFQVGIIAVLAAFLNPDLVSAAGGAYAIVVHGLQVVWYLSTGVFSLRFAGAGRTTLRQMVEESKHAAEASEAEAQTS